MMISRKLFSTSKTGMNPLNNRVFVILTNNAFNLIEQVEASFSFPIADDLFSGKDSLKIKLPRNIAHRDTMTVTSFRFRAKEIAWKFVFPAGCIKCWISRGEIYAKLLGRNSLDKAENFGSKPVELRIPVLRASVIYVSLDARGGGLKIIP